MRTYIFLLLSLAVAGCTPTYKTEPGRGTLSFGAKVFVDDGSCPEGQIKQVTGGNGQGVPRKRECVERPS